ncbi:lytic transglycosylase [Metarhizobium album]|uniref:Lytic transglycosylase n=1 Tax=Metarhizobium album TaxID=2182425 RepID=A0A2U2DK50_9HYPH|nr:lytic transglycosylase domain-containing protein [Rhizobium album]PWE53696.1 lytic transglycosylase [Rhizobium album]
MKKPFGLSLLLAASHLTVAEAQEISPPGFDSTRFSGQFVEPGAAHRARVGLENLERGRSFVIGTDGLARSETEPQALNSISLPARLNADVNEAKSEDTDGATEMRGFASLPEPCGPSPLEPAAIEALVIAAAERHGVEARFATAIAWVESRFDRKRNSPKGARGPMQLTPATAKRFGVADVCDPASNIDGGVRYLHVLLDEFKNPFLAAAAYNAGEQSIYTNDGIPPYPETVRYVAAVINRQLGLELPDRRATRPGRGVAIETAAGAPQPASDIIGARAPNFVGGVMQFPSGQFQTQE